ncbi:MAG: VanZ family protein, partial [Bacilli bacterium]
TFSKNKAFTAALWSSVLYAMSDEFHQYFISGRSAEWRDVVIDGSGAVIALTIIAIVNKYRKV